MKLEVVFKIQPSQEWSYKWFFSVKWVNIEVKNSPHLQTSKETNLEGALKLKRVKNKGIKGFKV